MTAVSKPLRLTLGANNVYALLDDSDCLLIDAGPDYPGAWEHMAAQLATHGIRPADVRQVVLTHAHRDHAGLAARWQRQGARIICGRADAPALLHDAESRQTLRERAAALLAWYGAPAEQLNGILPAREGTADHAASDGHGAWPGPLRMTPVRADLLVDDGAVVQLGSMRLAVVACPGHTPGTILLHHADSGQVFTGDHLLPQQVATVGLQFAGEARWPSMPPFARSLEHSRSLAGTVALPGHGDPMAGTSAAAEWSLRYIERRAARVLRRLRGAPATGYELVAALFPHHGPEHLVPVLTEIIGLLDLLTERGQVTATEHGGVLRFAPA